LVLGLAWALTPAMAADEAAADLNPSASSVEQWIEDVKHPTDWFEWGGDLRLRGIYAENVMFLLNEAEEVFGFEDASYFFRIRGRVWGKAGPFFVDEGAECPTGLSVYARVTSEPRYFAQRGFLGRNVPLWDEVVLDNLYVDWQRIGGAPVSVRVGRQDMVYGRGFVILDGTPLDGSRTIYQDAIKATVHLDELKSVLDLFYINNKGRQKRIRPLNETEGLVAAFDTSVFGAYLINKQLEGHELHAYYIYKDEDALAGGSVNNIHTVGGLAQGGFGGNWDYYAELAGQWGSAMGAPRKAFGLSSDLGYTFKDTTWTPRVHGGFEYLSGDDPTTRTFEGWDPVLARWPHWSELYVYTLAMEQGLPGQYTNVQRYTLGTSVCPAEKTRVDLDYSYLRANEHRNVVPAYPFGDGYTRGHLLVAKLTHTWSKWVSGHVWAEYFHPEDFYTADTDEAMFLRWQLMFKF
jgi:hypothetical protein